jgi:hypothetical protein
MELQVADQDAPDGNLAQEDGLWVALALFITVVILLGLAAYLYWRGTGNLPWA